MRLRLAVATLAALPLAWLLPFMAGTAAAHTTANVSHDLSCPTGDPGAGSVDTSTACTGEALPGSTGWKRWSRSRTDADSFITTMQAGAAAPSGTIVCVRFYGLAPYSSAATTKWGYLDSTGYWRYETTTNNTAGSSDTTANYTGPVVLQYVDNGTWHDNSMAPDYFFYRSYTGTLDYDFSKCSGSDPGQPLPPDRPNTGDLPSVTCGRSLIEDGGNRYVKLWANVGPKAGATDTGVWSRSWDSTTAAATAEGGYSVQWPLPAYSTQPRGGWYFTFTLTRSYGSAAANLNGFNSVGGGELENGGTTYQPAEDEATLKKFFDGLEDALYRLAWPPDWWGGYQFKKADGTTWDFDAVGGGDFGTQDFTTVTVRCGTVVDISVPAAGESPTQVRVPEAPAPTADDTAPEGAEGGECFEETRPVGDVTWNPLTWLRGAHNAALNVYNVTRSFSCVLRWAFVPPEGYLDGITDGMGDQFPINVATGATGALADVGASITTAIDAGNACVDVGVGGILNEGNTGVLADRDYGAVTVRLPTPSDSGCAGFMRQASRHEADNSIGDLFGFRTPIRAFLVFMLWLGVLYSIVRAFLPGNEEMEVGG